MNARFFPGASLEHQSLLATRTLVDRMRSLYRNLERLTGAPVAFHRALTCTGDASSGSVAIRHQSRPGHSRRHGAG